MRRPRNWLRGMLVMAAVAASACDDGERGGTDPADYGLGLGSKGKDAKPGGGAAAKEQRAAHVYRDSDFVESDRNRDPFRSYEAELRANLPVVAQRSVVMPDTPIDAMRLIAIISGIAQPRAMLVDEKGVGYVTTRGDFVGKADVIQGGGTESLPVTLNWRVDRIRENEVVLSREDPSAPNRPPLTRVIPLRDESEMVPQESDEG